jgi:hypothetical protein
MDESSQRLMRLSRARRRTSVPKSFTAENSSKFGIVVRALWPNKPALNLAQRSGLSERMAQYVIDGKRKPNARAALAVYIEIIG